MAASETTVIGRSAVVRGRITGSGDLEIAGRVEGEIACSGDVHVDANGLVAAPISARRIVVRGAVKGDLVAEESLVLETGARVVGDLRAPRISIAQGGLVRGYVQTGAAGAARPRTAQAASRAAAPAPAPAKKIAAAPAPAATVRGKTNHHQKPLPRGAALAGHRGPPAPVVPALKKGTKAAHKKR
jgi:cytoskeletal protein CcmA (bactofilin family)